MSKAACGKKALCNPPIRRISGGEVIEVIDRAEMALSFDLLKTDEIVGLTSADDWYLSQRKELDKEFCARYRVILDANLVRLQKEKE